MVDSVTKSHYASHLKNDEMLKAAIYKGDITRKSGFLSGYRSCGIPHGMSNCFVKEARAFQPVFYFIKNYFEVFKFFIIKF